MHFGEGSALHTKCEAIVYCLSPAVKSRLASSLDRPKQAAFTS
jgi:hypothetical protein